jgi:pimeloyl-ACP methyl ester carboxylesterase
MPAEQAEKISGFNASIFAALEKNDTDKAKQLLKEVLVYQFASMPDAVRDNYTSAEKYAEEMLEVQFRQLNAPWMRFFLRYDPQPALAELKMPVLLLFGENDLQVLPSQNKNVMEEALKKAGNQKFKSVLLPKANHLFEESETGEISDYGKKKVFVSGFFEAVKDFLKDFR